MSNANFDDTPKGKYLEYLYNHIHNVKKGYEWLKENCSDIFNSLTEKDQKWLEKNIDHHDEIKYGQEEFFPYMEYFYGEDSGDFIDDNSDIKINFNEAWNYHQKTNRHHWQYWILINDYDVDKLQFIDMPMIYIIEMICDWWSFSWRQNDLYEIFNWYNDFKNDIWLSDDTRYTVEMILDTMQNKLKEDNGE